VGFCHSSRTDFLFPVACRRTVVATRRIMGFMALRPIELAFNV
jgi:hypothetical protein